MARSAGFTWARRRRRASIFFLNLLAKYRGEHESYDLRFEIGPIHAIAERVARNDLDMAIVAGALPSGELQARSLSQDELVIIAKLTADSRSNTETQSTRSRNVVIARRGIRYEAASRHVVASSPTYPDTHDGVRQPRRGQACSHGRPGYCDGVRPHGH